MTKFYITQTINIPVKLTALDYFLFNYPHLLLTLLDITIDD